MRIFRKNNKNIGVTEIYFPGAAARRFFAPKKQGDYLTLKFDSIPEKFAALGVVKKNNKLKITGQVNIVTAIDLLITDPNYQGDRNKQIFEKLKNYREKLYQEIVNAEYLKQFLMGDAYKAVAAKFPCLDLNQELVAGQRSQKYVIQAQLANPAKFRSYVLNNPKIINQIVADLERNKDQLKAEIAEHSEAKRFDEAEAAKKLNHTINTEEVRQKFNGMVTSYLEESAKKLLLMQICEAVSGSLKMYINNKLRSMPTFFRFTKSTVVNEKIKLAMHAKSQLDKIYKEIDKNLEGSENKSSQYLADIEDILRNIETRNDEIEKRAFGTDYNSGQGMLDGNGINHIYFNASKMLQNYRNDSNNLVNFRAPGFKFK